MLSKKVKSRILFLVLVLLLATVVIFFILKSLEENIVYFFSPSEIYDKPNISFNEKIHPTGAKLLAINDINLILKIKFKIEAIPINPKHPSAIKDAGTCTYIILTESP